MRKWKIGFGAMLTALLLCMTLISASAATYMLGDADGDGEVTIVDATFIQRVLAKGRTDPDGGIALRGDVDQNGRLESIDATYIMRYKAKIAQPFDIGALIDEPTEPATEAPATEPSVAPTQKPTAKPDPYELPAI